MLIVPLIAVAQDKKDDENREEKKKEAEEKKEEAKDKAEDAVDDRDEVVDGPGTDQARTGGGIDGATQSSNNHSASRSQGNAGPRSHLSCLKLAWEHTPL